MTSTTPPLDQYFEHRDARLRFRDQGDGMPVIFVHGWTLDLEVWQPQASELRRSFRVIRLDRRGFGLSSGTPSIEDDVADLRALIDHLRLAKVAVVGMSQGARVALQFALGNPPRLAALVLDGAPHPALPGQGDADEDLPLARYRELVRTGGLEAFRAEWQVHPLMTLHTRDASARQLLERIAARYPGSDLRAGRPQSDGRIDLSALRSLRQPTLVLNGALDTEHRREVGDLLARSLPLAERQLVPNAGHLANLDEPQVYNDLIKSFLMRQARIAA